MSLRDRERREGLIDKKGNDKKDEQVDRDDEQYDRNNLYPHIAGGGGGDSSRLQSINRVTHVYQPFALHPTYLL